MNVHDPVRARRGKRDDGRPAGSAVDNRSSRGGARVGADQRRRSRHDGGCRQLGGQRDDDRHEALLHVGVGRAELAKGAVAARGHDRRRLVVATGRRVRGHVVVVTMVVAMAVAVVCLGELGRGRLRDAAEEQRVAVAAARFPDDLRYNRNI